VNALSEMSAALSEVEAILPDLHWQRVEDDRIQAARVQDPTVRAYLGEQVGVPGGWCVTVTSFDIAPQGFPPGSRGHDGAAARRGLMIRLTRDLAKKAYAVASRSVT